MVWGLHLYGGSEGPSLILRLSMAFGLSTIPLPSWRTVVCESVTAFPEDKRKAVSEYVRITKPGGHIGLNETTWLKTPPAGARYAGCYAGSV